MLEGSPELQRPNSLIPERAVVLGCGMAGIAAAAALQKHFAEVVIIERDAIPKRAEPRRGVPQHAQLHNLLSCAQINLEDLLPGFIADLRQAGASDASVASQTHVYEFGAKAHERDLGLRLMSAWQPNIEHTARKKLLDKGRVTIEGITKVVGIRASKGRVSGVIAASRDIQKTIPASLIVDATGVASQAERWLDAVDAVTPNVEHERVDQWYVSTTYKRPSEYVGHDDFWLTFPNPPQTQGGLISPVGNDEWYVSLSGRSANKPPETVEEVNEYAATLEDNATIASLIKHAVPTSQPSIFRRTHATMRHYEQIGDPLIGFLPVGDAFARLNPLHGQGMSVAAQQAKGLDLLLTERTGGRISLEELTTLYLGKAATAAESAWNLGRVVEHNIAKSPDPQQVKRRYDALAQLIEGDADVHRLYVGVLHLIEPASALLAPEIQDRLDELVALH